MATLPFVYALMCLTGLTPKEKCPTRTPISSYQLNHIWSPTNPYLADKYQQGYWTKSKGATAPDFTSLRGRKLTIAAIVEPPYVYEVFKNGTINGTAQHVIYVLRQALGFDFNVVQPQDNTVGIFNKTGDGKWSGIMGMLQSGEADFSIQFISMLPIRTAAVNFSSPFGEERWMILMSRPTEATDGDGLVAPFQRDVWWMCLAALIAMGPFAWLMVRLKCIAFRNYPEHNVPYSIGGCIWFVFGALMKQGSVLKPVADSTRILFATWWIYVTILTAFYTANLTAYLTLSKIPIPYDSLQKIGYRDAWATREGDTIEQVMRLQPTPNDTAKGILYYKKETPYPEFYKLRWRFGRKPEYDRLGQTEGQMVDWVRKEKVLLLDESNRVERIIYRDFRNMSNRYVKLALRCSFIMSKQPILRVPYGFGFKNQTLRDIFAPVVQKLAVGGLFDYWRRQDLPVKDPCSENSDFRERQLRNGDLLTTYMLCFAGYSLGLLSFILEFVHKWMSNRKIKTQLVPTDKTQLSFYKGNLAVPPGAPTYFDTEKFLKNINGRNYIVMKTADGRTRLVPKSDGMQALQPQYQPPPLISFGYMS